MTTSSRGYDVQARGTSQSTFSADKLVVKESVKPVVLVIRRDVGDVLHNLEVSAENLQREREQLLHELAELDSQISQLEREQDGK
jgi:prefoldin subunit 5